jgi:Fe2+ transport system protein B
MPRAPRYSKNERTLRLELARVARRLHKSEEKKDDLVERCFDRLVKENKEKTRRARQAEQAARRALELIVEHQHARQAEQARARSPSAHQAAAAAVCMFAVFVRLLFL